MIRLFGKLICKDEQEAACLRAHLPEHIRLSRAEIGCLRFEVTPSEHPLVWSVEESFTDQAAFDAHQARTRASQWFAATTHIRRDYTITGEIGPQ